MTREHLVSVPLCLLALTGVQPRHVHAQEFVSTQAMATARHRLDLDGPWNFRLDPERKGQQQKWHSATVPFADTIQVPGCWQAQGFGVETAAMKFFSVDDGWYKRTFTVPNDWQGGEVWLNIGGVKPAADVWVNDRHIGFTASSRTPLNANVTDCVRFGEQNTVCIRVAWPKVRLDGVWDWGDCVWSGVYRSVFLESTAGAWMDEVWVRTEAAQRLAHVEFAVRGPKRKGESLRVRCQISPVAEPGRSYHAEQAVGPVTDQCARVCLDVAMPDARLWSPDEPALYRAELSLLSGAQVVDQVSVRFGLREIAVKGTQILLNGSPIFLRGGCDDQVYPETICPPASKEFFVKRLRLAKQYGFNYTKSCIEVFTPEFLDAADEVGLLVCQEMPFGLSGEYRSTRRDPPSEFETLYRAELGNIITADRNHPSVAIYSITSELELTENSLRIFGQELPRRAKQLNPSALVIDVTAGFGFSRQTQFGERVTDIIEECGLGLEPLRPRPSFDAALDAPYIAHEHQWWSCLPNPRTKAKYAGLPVKPDGVIDLERAAAKSGLTDALPQLASELLIETSLRDAAGGTINRNQWQIWALPQSRCDLRGKGAKTSLAFMQKAYPGVTALDRATPPGDAALFVTDAMTEEAVRYVESGGKVLLLSAGDLPAVRDPHCNLFRTVPYNTGNTGNMGTLIADHPALARFPHNGWCELQFFYLISGIWPFDLEAFQPAKIDPIVRCIGHHKTMRNKAYLFEAAMGRGALVATTFNIAGTFATRPETQCLVDELLQYCLSAEFKPRNELPAKFFLDRIQAKR